VPARCPGRARDYTYASGVAELGVATALAVAAHPQLRWAAGGAAVPRRVPGQYADGRRRAGQPKAPQAFKIGTVLRLPLQIPLITQSLKVSRRARRS